MNQHRQTIASCIVVLLPKKRKMLGPQCTENPPNISSTCGTGHVEEIAGVKSYITGNSDLGNALLLAADAFGYEAPKLRKLADKFAASGFLVVVPDFFHGDPFVLDPEFDRDAWQKAHTLDIGCEEAREIIAALRNKGVSQVGAAGFCWGGMLVARLAKHDCIQAAILLHPAPGPLTVEDINGIKTPIAILGAENDEYTLAEHLKKVGDMLAEKAEVDSYVKIFPGVGHGWTVRYNDDDKFAVKSAEESHADTLNWFAKHIK